MSDENITFVGGKAIEQHEQAESGLESSEKAEAVKAVREAIEAAAKEAGEESEKASRQDPYKPPGAKGEAVKKDPETGRFLPKGDKKEEAESEEDDDEEIDTKTAPLKQLLKAREKLAKQKASVKDELGRERESLAAQAQQLKQAYGEIQRMQADIARERQKLELLRKDPARAVREIGWEPEQFITDLAKDGTPEGIAERQRREMQSQLEEIRNWKAEMAKQQEQARQQYEYNQQVQFRQHIEKQFLDMAFNDEKNPHIAEFYKGREQALIAEGDLIAADFRELAGGREASLEEIVDYIEEQLANRTKSWYEKRSGTKKDTDPQVVGKKPSKGPKGKTLSPDMTGERSTLNKKALKDLDDEERRIAAKESVGLALASAAER